MNRPTNRHCESRYSHFDAEAAFERLRNKYLTRTAFEASITIPENRREKRPSDHIAPGGIS